jgi:hypothetical protein
MSAKDYQVAGDHYSKLPIQPIDYIIANDLPFCEGNIVKYVTRHRDKGGREDIEKVIQYAEFLLEQYDREEPTSFGEAAMKAQKAAANDRVVAALMKQEKNVLDALADNYKSVMDLPQNVHFDPITHKYYYVK